jgi:hypothetical protein
LKAATSASISATGSACAAACASLAALAVLSLLSLPSLLPGHRRSWRCCWPVRWARCCFRCWLLSLAALALLFWRAGRAARLAGLLLSLRLAAGRSAALGATLTTGLLFWR